MTETCSGTVGLKLLDEPENKLYAGRPFSNVRIWNKNGEIMRKDLIITGGENVNPLEVENSINLIDGITDVAVVGESDKEWGQKVVAYIVMSVPYTSEILNEKLKTLLSSYKIPKEYIRVSNIPRNELGKIEYRKIKFL